MSGSTRASSPSEPVVELCTFRVGAEEYVLDLKRVREVVNPLPVRRVPRSPEAIEGVVSLRGEVIPLVDVRLRFGLEEAPLTRKAKLLIVRVAGRVLALAVDAVLEVMRIPRSAIRPAPAMPGGEGPPLFLGTCDGGERIPGGGTALRFLLNVKALTGPIAPEALDAARTLASRGGEP